MLVILNKINYDSGFIGYEVSRISFHVIINYVVATIPIVNGVISFCLAVSFQRRYSILTRSLIDTFPNKHKTHEHLAQAFFGSMGVRMRVGGIVGEIDSIAIGTWVGKSNV